MKVSRLKSISQNIFRRNITNYALIISGGRGERIIFDKFINPLPEESEFKNAKNIYHTLINSAQFESEHVKLIFGDNIKKNAAGENVLDTCFDYRIRRRVFHKYLAREIFLVDKLPSKENLKKEFNYNYLITRSPPRFFYVTGRGKLKEKPDEVTAELQKFVAEIDIGDENLPLSKICSLDAEKYKRFVSWLDLEGRGAKRPTPLIESLPPIYGKNILDNIKSAFIDIINKSKKDDNLFIFLDGHGIKSRGIVLWNDANQKNLFSLPNRNSLGLSQLNEILSLNKDKCKIIILINSCYSGIYNRIIEKNVGVITSTRINRVSYYQPGFSSKNINEILQYWRNPQVNNLLLQHAKGSIKSENFYPSDNLTYHIDSKFKNYLFPRLSKIQNSYYNFITSKYYKNPIYGIRFDRLKELAILGFILIDPSGIISTLYSTKILAAIAKMGLPIFKLCLYFVFRQLYKKSENYIQGTELYKTYPVLYDKRLIFFMRKRIINNLKKKARFTQ